MAALASHCGQAFAGRIVVDEPVAPGPDAFAGKALVMHVRGCDAPARELRVPFHVGDDHSRTWVITRTATGMRLTHHNLHPAGRADVLTMYARATAAPGRTVPQECPVDPDTIASSAR